MSELAQSAEHALAVDGFVELESPEVGESIRDLEQQHFPLASEHGLDFIQHHIFDDNRVTSIINSIFPDGCVIGHFLRYQAYPGKAVSLWRRHGSQDGRHAIVVHFLPKGSKVNYIRGSHLLELPLESGSRLLWEAPVAELLAKTECEQVQKYFEDGGLIILDTRTLYVMEQSYVIKCEITTQDVVETWRKIILPRTKTLEDKLAAIQSSQIRINATFLETATSTKH